MISDRDRPRLTVLNIIPDERLGGPQRRVLQVAEGLLEAGIDTIVVTPSGDRTYAHLLEDAGIPHHQIRTFRRLPSGPSSAVVWCVFFLPATATITRLIRREKVDIVHLNGSLSIQAGLAARLSGATLLWHLNDVRRFRVIRLMLLPLLKWLPHRIAASSRAVGQAYFGSTDSARRLTVVYPPVDTARFQCDDAMGREYRKQLGITPQDWVVGTVGNINPSKGYEYFFAAAGQIKRAVPQAKFLIVGKQVETQEGLWKKLQRMIEAMHLEDAMIFTGPRTDVPPLLNAMDVFVLSSVSESFSMATAEALACERAVVATRCGGPEELITSGENGILVPPGDPDALAEAVISLLTNPERRYRMGKLARERMVEHFSLENAVRSHERAYREALAPADQSPT